MKDRLSSRLNFIMTLISIAGIGLISSGQTSLKPASQISDATSEDNLVLPPGFTFGIWSVIYLGLILYSFYQLSAGGRESSRINATRDLVTLSIFLNLVWIVCVGLDAVIFPYILQWFMLYIAVVIVERSSFRRGFSSMIEKLCFITLTLYAGWLTVAMIPFTSDILLLYGWQGEPLTLEVWAVGLYVIAFALVFLIYFKRLRIVWYTLPLTWALIGIAIRFWPGVGIAAGVLSLLGILIFINEAAKGHA